MEFRQKLTKTEHSLKQVEYEKALLEKKLDSLDTSSKQTIERLQNDKIKLELSLIQLENQLRETHQEKENLLQQSKENSNSLQLLNKNSSSSSLSSIPNNTSLLTPAAGGSVHSARSAGEETTLTNCVRSTVEALGHIYTSLDERNTYLKPFLANGPNAKLAVKCEQTLSSIEAKFKSGKVDPTTLPVALVDEYFDLNRRLLLATVAELGVSTSVSLAQSTSTVALARPSEDMDKLHKKLKIYLNKIDAFLFDQTIANQVHFIYVLNVYP